MSSDKLDELLYVLGIPNKEKNVIQFYSIILIFKNDLAFPEKRGQ